MWGAKWVKLLLPPPSPQMALLIQIISSEVVFKTITRLESLAKDLYSFQDYKERFFKQMNFLMNICFRFELQIWKIYNNSL